MSTQPIGYGKLLRNNKAFRRLWYGQVVSQLGDWFELNRAVCAAAAADRLGAGGGYADGSAVFTIGHSGAICRRSCGPASA